MMRIGVLALQGDFDAHRRAIEAAGAIASPVRTPEELSRCHGLILPGGESTTIGKLMARFGMDIAIRQAHAGGLPIFGTCAGMILLARSIASGEKSGGQPLLGLMDISVARNAFGRQVDSFEARIESSLGTLQGVFIRAPYIVEAGPGVEELACYEGRLVLARQKNLLAAAFHPELTGDLRVHRYFLEMVKR